MLGFSLNSSDWNTSRVFPALLKSEWSSNKFIFLLPGFLSWWSESTLLMVLMVNFLISFVLAFIVKCCFSVTSGLNSSNSRQIPSSGVLALVLLSFAECFSLFWILLMLLDLNCSCFFLLSPAESLSSVWVVSIATSWRSGSIPPIRFSYKKNNEKQLSLSLN